MSGRTAKLLARVARWRGLTTANVKRLKRAYYGLPRPRRRLTRRALREEIDDYEAAAVARIRAVFSPRPGGS